VRRGDTEGRVVGHTRASRSAKTRSKSSVEHHLAAYAHLIGRHATLEEASSPQATRRYRRRQLFAFRALPAGLFLGSRPSSPCSRASQLVAGGALVFLGYGTAHNVRTAPMLILVGLASCGGQVSSRPSDAGRALRPDGAERPDTTSTGTGGDAMTVAACAAGHCTASCSPGATCTSTCTGGYCVFQCAAGSNCTNTCAGGHCVDECATGSVCTNSCAGGFCVPQCPTGSTCANTCTTGCVFQCAAGACTNATCPGGDCPVQDF
jgi:hypothetical protein